MGGGRGTTRSKGRARDLAVLPDPADAAAAPDPAGTAALPGAADTRHPVIKLAVTLPSARFIPHHAGLP